MVQWLVTITRVGILVEILVGSLVGPLVGMSTFAMAAQASPPNILFILADDVGSEVLQCYGGESYETPRLDRLAREGLRFEHAYAVLEAVR